MIYNLLSNAFKFSDEARAPVRITLQRSDDSIAIMVRDQGIGIPQDKLESIFDRFSQVDARATRRYQGTGIGLALVREAVQAHDGDVRVESTLGQGSTFTISLPRGATADLIEPVASVSTPSDLALPGQQDQQITCNVLLSFPETERAPLILVAEDNTDLRNYLYSILAPSFRVIVCPDGAAAIEMHRRHAPEVVLTDLMMPGVGGEGVIKALRAAAGSVQTPIIVLTADIEPQTRASLLEQGAADFLAKPFDEKELFARIRVALRLRQQEQRLDALAHKDGLTDIANRRQFDRQLADAWHSALAAGQPLSLLICDIDYFKHFNDRYGHPAGDDCLKQVARVVEGALYRTVDLAARYGGEEFAVLLPVTEPDGATVVARRIVEGVQALGIAHDRSEVAKVVTVSVGGFTLWPEPDLPLERITKLADEQLYQAKRSGRNQVQMAVQGSGAAYPAVSPPGDVSSGALEAQ